MAGATTATRGVDRARLEQSVFYHSVSLEFYLSQERIRGHFPRRESSFLRSLGRFDSEFDAVPPFQGPDIWLDRHASSLFSKSRVGVLGDARRKRMSVHAALAPRTYFLLLLPLLLFLYTYHGLGNSLVASLIWDAVTVVGLVGLVYHSRRNAADELARRLRILYFHDTGTWPE